jgi:signal transduction histidine kinase
MAFFPNSLRAQIAVIAAINLLCIGGLVVGAVYLTGLQREVTTVNDGLTAFYRLFDRMRTSLAEMRHLQIEYSAAPETGLFGKAVSKIDEAQSGIDKIGRLNDTYEKPGLESLSEMIETFRGKLNNHHRQAVKLYLGNDTASYAQLKLGTGKLVDVVRGLNNFALLSSAEDLRAMVSTPDCGGAVRSAYAFRKLVEHSLSSLSQSRLPLRDEIQIHSAINRLRGDYGSFILQCREFERQRVELWQLSNEIIDRSSQIIDPLGQLIDTRVGKLFGEQRRIVILVLSVSILFLTGAILVTLYFAKSTSERLLGIRDAIQDIAHGNVHTEVPYTRNVDETGDVARAVEEFRLNKIALSQALNEAVAGEKAKTEFLGTMSHELRTPLNIVIGYSEAITGGIFGEMPERFRDPVTQIFNSGTHLLNIINQVLDMVPLGNASDRGKGTAVRPDVEMRPILQSLENIRKSRDVTVACDLQAGLAVICNETHYRQIVTNLVDNALKFTGVGSTVTIRSHAEADGRVVLSIADKGPGMSEAEIERAVQPFVQIGDHLTRRHGGIGLGLAIVSRLCAMNAGSIAFRSTEGQGTIVLVTLPAAGRVADAGAACRMEKGDRCLTRVS